MGKFKHISGDDSRGKGGMERGARVGNPLRGRLHPGLRPQRDFENREGSFLKVAIEKKGHPAYSTSEIINVGWAPPTFLWIKFMPDYRRARDESTFFFTVVTYERQAFLCLSESRSALREVVAEVRKSYPFTVQAWVLLPDHLHCIWELPQGDNDYSLRWALIKKGFTKRMKDQLSAASPNKSRMRHREAAVWQRRFWEHQIMNEGDFSIHCDYIHYNPVKHGLARSPKDWEYSTFHSFVRAGMYPENWGGAVSGFPDNMGGE